MKTIITIEQEVDIKTVYVKADVRYWEDATVNGIQDEEGKLIPCREGDLWCPIIDIDSGIITNWTKGVTADVHFKVCDSGTYELKDADGKSIIEKEDYVPNNLIPGEYGDYINMTIDADGKIAEWEPSFEDFF